MSKTFLQAYQSHFCWRGIFMQRVFHLSNTLTYMAVIFGFFAFAMVQHSPTLAAGLLSLCGVCDLMDGKFASLFQRSDEQKEFGVQIDSLADAMNFGPLLVGCLFLNTDTNILFFLSALLYLLALASRLAYYNLQSLSGAKGFIGMPSTLNALLFSWPLYMSAPNWVYSTLLLGSSFLMISKVKVVRPSSKFMISLIVLYILSATYQLTQAVL